MKRATVDPSFPAGGMLRQTAAGTSPLPHVLPPEIAAEQLGSCTLLLLDLPKPKKKSTSHSAETGTREEDDEELQLGLDYSMWRVGPQFSGVKCIQPGCHLLYSRINRADFCAAELAGHADAAEKAVAAEDAAAAAASPDAANVDAGAPAPAEDSSAALPHEGGFECMYTAMRVEEAIGEIGREKRGGLQRGEFLYMEPHTICIRRWDHQSKTFLRLPDEDEEQRYIRAVKRLEFDRKLGVYPQRFRHVWGLLTDFISPQCLRRLEPLSRSFSAAALPLSDVEQQRLQQRLGNEEVAESVIGGAVIEAGEAESERRAQHPHMDDEEETGVRFYFTEIPPVRTAAVSAARRAEARAKHGGATATEAAAAAAAALTEAAVDRTDTLLQVLKKVNKRLDDLEDACSRKKSAAAASRRTLAKLALHCAPLTHTATDAAAAAATAAAAIEEEKREEERLWRSLASSEACQDLLGELQLAYLAFLLGQRYDGFEQWKQLLTLLSQCARAVRLLPEFYASLLRVFYCQIEHCPDNFLQDPLLQRSFLVASAISLVNICSNVAPLDEGTDANTSENDNRMKANLLEGDEALLDRAERKAVLQRVEQRAAWLQELLIRTFGETLSDPVVNRVPDIASNSTTALERLRRQGLASSSMHEEEEEGPVVVDESELIRAGVLLDDNTGPSSQGPRQQQTGNPLAPAGGGEIHSGVSSSTGQDSVDAGGSCMEVDTG